MPRNKGVYLSNNISWTLQKGSWMIHFILTILFYALFSQIFKSVKGAQMTVIMYNVSTFIFFHWIVGDPFDKNFREFTFWEQMADQLSTSSTLIFMSLYPVILFMVVNRMVVWDTKLYVLALISLVLVVVPKLSFMHMRRLFKRYD